MKVVRMTLNSLGLLYNDNSAHKKAQSAYEEALEIYRTLALLSVIAISDK
jgi:hypothetical protein